MVQAKSVKQSRHIKVYDQPWFRPVVVLGAATIVIIVILISQSIKDSSDFNVMFSDLKSNNWFSVSQDSKSVSIDTDPTDKGDFYNEDGNAAIERVNERLGFSEALYEKMISTRALDGMQNDENVSYKVTWTYHPDDGLEVIYEKK